MLKRWKKKKQVVTPLKKLLSEITEMHMVCYLYSDLRQRPALAYGMAKRQRNGSWNVDLMTRFQNDTEGKFIAINGSKGLDLNSAIRKLAEFEENYSEGPKMDMELPGMEYKEVRDLLKSNAAARVLKKGGRIKSPRP